MGTLWAKARNARFLKTPLLRLLDTMTELREPLLRPTHDAECDSCLRDHGPWAQCVVLDDPVGLVCGCANCHWDSNAPAALRSARDRLTERPPPTVNSHLLVRTNPDLRNLRSPAFKFLKATTPSLRPAARTSLWEHLPTPPTKRPQDIQPEIERTTDLADQCQAGVDWLIARKPQSRDIMRRAMANVRDNKVIHQTLINTTEAVAESVNDSTASSDQILQDNIALTVGAVATNGRNVKAIEISTQEMQAEDLMLYFRLEEAQLQLPNLNARQTRPL
ncbi:hypothetical protein EN45_093750 [Penicillium chrysogenum]|uniref:Uncharacterized protein n=1 Tax=Penicillium chrysogenum TaxID=5076 RepID=A0A162C1P7_PENCH|nr:hypothetical protein EN45_093750 [Penicillium chrysogenum]